MSLYHVFLFFCYSLLTGLAFSWKSRRSVKSVVFPTMSVLSDICSKATNRDTNIPKPKVALTRELGANTKLSAMLSNLDCVEIPCIQCSPCMEKSAFESGLNENDVVVLTSPQASRIFIKKWLHTGKPHVRVVSVGKGTSEPLHAVGIIPVFEPTIANAATLSEELPMTWGRRVFYPTSSLSDGRLKQRLEQRNFQVSQVVAYQTVPAEWTVEALHQARRADIVTFASPSAVRNWAQNVGKPDIAVVIGDTSGAEARRFDFPVVHSPPPGGPGGMKPWADLIQKVAEAWQPLCGKQEAL